MQGYPLDKIIASFENRLSPEDQQRMKTWLLKSEENQEFYNETKKLYTATQKIRIDFTPDTNKALQKVNRNLRRREIVHWSYRAAAVLFLFALIGRIFLFPPAKWNDISAQSRQTIFLPDSSKVILAKNATLKFPDKFNKKQRLVYLDGLAYFEVTKNKKHPFLIETKNTSIEVLGTHFLVDASKENSEKVWVDEGKVAFSTLGPNQLSSTILTSNEVGIWSQKSSNISELVFSNLNQNAWLSGRLTFEDTSLDQVIQEIESFFNIKVDVQENIRNRRYSGSFTENNPAEEALQVLCFTLNLRLQKTNDKYLITP